MPEKNLLLLPGMMCDERLWKRQIEALNVNCLVADLMSHDNIPDMAAAILDSAPDMFAAAGLSMGGIVAFELWRQAPQRITHLALLDTNPYADTPDKRTMRMDQVRQVLSGQLKKLATDSLKPAYLASANRDNQELLDEILAMALDAGEEVFERQSLALKDRADSVTTLDTIDCPTAVICGAEDHICPPAYHELMARRIPGARLVVIENCGHLATMEQPDIVNRELQRLLQHGGSHANQ